jgi:hypothetical protein
VPKTKRVITAGDLVTEAQVEETCSAFLALDGWIALVTDPKQLRGLGVTEPGIADRQYRRYKNVLPCIVERIPVPPRGTTDFEIDSICNLMHIEWKRIRSGKATKTSAKQDAWHERERARGGLTLRAGIDFPATISGFCTWYAKSGLMRKQLRIPG